MRWVGNFAVAASALHKRLKPLLSRLCALTRLCDNAILCCGEEVLHCVEASSISITFEAAQTAIGVETLESIGLKLDPVTGQVESRRPRRVAYFY